MVSRFFSDTLLDDNARFPVEEVFAWHSRPAALQRLTPDWFMAVQSEPASLSPGSRAELLLTPLPGLAGMLPISRPGLTWVAEHTEFSAAPSNRVFTDEMVSGPLTSWTHQHEFHALTDEQGARAGTRITDTVSYELPVSWDIAEDKFTEELTRVFDFRERTIRADLDFHHRLRSKRLTVVLSGASGLVGTQVSAMLRTGGHRVVHLVRRPGQPSRLVSDTEISWDPDAADGNGLDADLLIGVDAVISFSGASIAAPFTASHRAEVMSSRVNTTNTLVRALRTVARHGGPRTFVCASASGYYGADASEHDADAPFLDESAPTGHDFLAAVTRQWETIARSAEDAGIRVVNIRTGLVMTACGGLLAPQLPLYLAGLGGPIGSGQMWQPWISLNDLAQIYLWALTHEELSGPVNAAAPHPVQQKEFAETLGEVLGRPTGFPTPSFAPALLLGRQANSELVLSSARLTPRKLLDSGYTFRDETIGDALAHTLGKA